MKVASPDSSYNPINISPGGFSGTYVKIVKTNHLLYITWATDHISSSGGDNVIQVILLNGSTQTFNLRTNGGGSTVYTDFILPLSCKSISIISEPN